jgi:hypothetical protein
MSYPLIKFYGARTDKVYLLPVAYITDDFARGPDGTCAFCRGDPCAEDPRSPNRIHEYMAGEDWMISKPVHCPFCKGRPT